MNSFVLQGTICKDPEMRYLSDGNKQMCRWKISAKDARADSPDFEILCSAWGNLADAVISQYKLNDVITVEGRLQMNLVEKDGGKRKVPEIICSKVHSNFEMPF